MMRIARVFAVFLFCVSVYSDSGFGAALSQNHDPAYRIAPENVLQIDVYYGRGERISQRVRVSSLGVINFPLVGQVSAVDQTVAELQEKLAQILGERYLVNPQVTVFIEEYSTVSIMGEVNKPGAYPIKGRLNVIELVSLAEGFTKLAAVNKVKIIRSQPDGQKEEILVRVNDLMTREGDFEDGMALRAGDVVIVPESGSVSIIGEIKRPGVYPIKDRLTLIELISLAEGFTRFAAANKVKVIHTEQDGTKTERIIRVADQMNSAGGDGRDEELRSGDVVIVPQGML